MRKYYRIARNSAEQADIVAEKAARREYVMDWGCYAGSWEISEEAAAFLDGYWDAIAREGAAA